MAHPPQEHGNTPAAWTAVSVMFVGTIISGLGVAVLNWPLFWIGLAVVVLGAVVGKVMQMMGMGQTVSYRQDEAERRAGSEPAT
jgi:hypothetical protein